MTDNELALWERRRMNTNTNIILQNTLDTLKRVRDIDQILRDENEEKLSDCPRWQAVVEEVEEQITRIRRELNPAQSGQHPVEYSPSGDAHQLPKP